jgi:hypothetical protein
MGLAQRLRTWLFGKDQPAFRAFVASEFRHNLAELTRMLPDGMQAHHMLPQKFAGRFTGINIHDPKYGAWWESVTHGKAANAYNAAWEEFFAKNPEAKAEDFLNFARRLAKRYALDIYF